MIHEKHGEHICYAQWEIDQCLANGWKFKPDPAKQDAKNKEPFRVVVVRDSDGSEIVCESQQAVEFFTVGMNGEWKVKQEPAKQAAPKKRGRPKKVKQ